MTFFLVRFCDSVKTSVASARLLMPLAMFLISLKSISVTEEINNLLCALLVSQKGVSTVNSTY